MYACILEIGRGFFEGACTPSNATAHLCDPPPPSLKRRLVLPYSKCSGQVLARPHHLRRHRGSADRSGLAPAPSVLLHGSRSLRSPGCYLPHSQDWRLQLRQVLHCDPRLLSVGGGGGFLRLCMAYPALGAILLGSHGAARECFRRAASNPA